MHNRRDTPSLFSALHKWAKRQDENYCTEGLIFLLRLMLLEVPRQALVVIDYLTNGLIGESDRPQTIFISGQVVGAEGRLDIELRTANKIAWIEVKVDSKVAHRQLAKYRQMLSVQTSHQRLILLSRGGDQLEEDNRPHAFRRWIDLSSELIKCSRSPGFSGTRSAIYLDDYLSFLGTRQMRLNHVPSGVANSIQDAGSLLSVVKEAIRRAGLHAKSCNGETSFGYTLKNEIEELGWVGFNITDPQWLFYTTEGQKQKIDLELAERVQVPGGSIENGKHWANSIDLVECAEFFELNPDGQAEYLRANLIQASIETLAKIIAK
jgi:hypothetical protein